MSSTPEKVNCKISIDCYGGIVVEAPTVDQAQQLLDKALSVKTNKPINQAIR